MKNSHVAVIDERPLCPKAGVGEGNLVPRSEIRGRVVPYTTNGGARRTFQGFKFVDWYRLGCWNLKRPLPEMIRFIRIKIYDDTYKKSLRRNPNLALTRTNVVFPLTFTVILPSVTRTLDNSNLPLTRSNFCFPSAHFYTILPSITRTLL